MEGVSFKMVKFRLPLLKKKFGIKEPNNSLFKLAKIDIAIVPILGVDKNFQRVGFGKGMYDRFFNKLKYKPLIIFVQLDKCFINQNICDVYDIKCDYLITPKEILIIR